jgi:hypothetical protein
MAGDTIPFQVVFVQHQAGNGVSEVKLVPAAMTGIAVAVEFANFLPCGMAGATFELVVILI